MTLNPESLKTRIPLACGLAPAIVESNSDLLRTEFGKRVHELVKAGKGVEAYDAGDIE